MRAEDGEPFARLRVFTELFGWKIETVRASGARYLALDLGVGIQGGIVERESEQAIWLPYVEVSDIREATDRARDLGARVAVEPREGPAGWRSELTVSAGAEVALWQPKG